VQVSTTDDVFDLMDGYITSAALSAALELGLFWRIAEQPMDPSALSQALSIPVKRCQYWLQLLSSIGLLEPGPEGYTPSPAARSAILDVYSQDAWAFLARDARERFPAILDLALHLREPGSVCAAQGWTPPDYFALLAESPERARGFTRMLYELHLPLAEDLAGFLDMTGVDRLMDLGGGSGVMSLALLRRSPRLTAVVVDIPNVCTAARQLVREVVREAGVQNARHAAGDGIRNHPPEGRIAYHAADFLHDELPAGFDMVLECDVGDFSEGLFRKIHAALNPGGQLVIVDQFAPEEGLAPWNPPYPLWAFLGSLEDPDAGRPTAAEIEALLVRSGFRLLSAEPLPHREAPRWSEGWLVMQAGT
jgi:SAM-dependent methyltransferase